LNFPVKNLPASMDFFAALGFAFNPQFTDQNAACMVIGEDIHAMLLVEEFFKNFTTKSIVDTSTHKEVLVALFVDLRAKVDKMVELALASGGSEPSTPQDHGIMCSRVFNDLDGHTWEIGWMNPAHVQ
jgi:uncharacterized protein